MPFWTLSRFMAMEKVTWMAALTGSSRSGPPQVWVPSGFFFTPTMVTTSGVAVESWATSSSPFTLPLNSWTTDSRAMEGLRVTGSTPIASRVYLPAGMGSPSL